MSFFSWLFGSNNHKRSAAYAAPEVTGSYLDKCGRTVWKVSAANSVDAASLLKGTTIEGDVSRAVVKTGRGKYEIRVEEWDT